MSSLREVQRDFLAALLRRDPAAQRHVRPNRIDGERRLQVYRNNLFASLGDALAAVYPVVARLVGEDFFRHCAHEYVLAHPSRSGNLHDFGAEFADFLRGFPGASALPYLPDVARLEWAYHEVFHAAEMPALDLAALAAVAAEVQPIRLGLQPCTRLLASPYPVLRIWQVNQESYAGDASVSLDEGGVRLLVTRHDLEIEFWRLGAGEFALLQALAGGAALGEAIAVAIEAEGGMDAAACLARHIGAGHFGALLLPD